MYDEMEQFVAKVTIATRKQCLTKMDFFVVVVLS